MDNPKHKDEMLAAGKKRLEQFRQKKQGKGSSSKQNKQETDIEHGRPRAEVVQASHKDNKSKTNAISSDLQGSKAKGTRMHTSSDDQGVANSRFCDDNKGFSHDLIVEKSGDKSPINTEHGCTSDLDIGSARAFHAEGNTLEQYRVAAEKMPATGNGEFCLTLDPSQLQPSEGPLMTSQIEKPLEQNHSDLAGAPDLMINVADLIPPDFSINHDLAKVEYGTSEKKNEKNILLSSLEAFQACDNEQSSGLELFASRNPPCSNNDYPDVTAMETTSEYGDKMEANQNAEAIPTGFSYTSLEVPTSSQSTSGRDEGDASHRSVHDFESREVGMAQRSPLTTDVLEIVAQVAREEEEACSSESYAGTYSISESQSEPPMVNLDRDMKTASWSEVNSSLATKTSSVVVPTSLEVPTSSQSTSGRDEGDASHQSLHDFESREVGMAQGSPMTTDVLEIVAQVAREEEEACSSESYAGTYSISESQSEPSMVNLDTDVVMDSWSEVNSSLVTQTSSVENVTDSHLEARLVGWVPKEISSFDQPQTGELDVSMVKAFSESILYHEGVVSINDHGLESSEDAAMIPTIEDMTEMHHKGIRNESVPNEICDFEGSQITGELGVSPKPVLQYEGLDPTDDNAYKGLENASMNPIVGISPDSHSEGLVLGSVAGCNLEHAESDVGLSAVPLESSLDHQGLSLTNDHGPTESQDASCQDELAVVQRESMLDIAGTEAKLLVDFELAEEMVETNCAVSGNLEHNRTSLPLYPKESVENSSGSLAALPVDGSNGEPSLAQEGLQADKLLDQFPETDLPAITNHYEIGTSSGENPLSNGADLRSMSGTPQDPEDPQQGAWESVHVESSVGNIQESSPEDDLRSFRSLEVVGTEQATVEDQIKMQSIDVGFGSSDLKDCSPPTNSPEKIVVSEDSGQTTLQAWNSCEGPLLSCGNGTGIDQGDMNSIGSEYAEVVSVAVEDVKCLDSSMDEMTLPSMPDVPSCSLEREERTGPFEELKPLLDFGTASFKTREVAGEVPLESNNGNTGIAPSALPVDNSCSYSIINETGDGCTGGDYLKHAATTPSLDAEHDLTKVEQGEEDVIAEAGQLKLETDSLSSLCGNEVKCSQKADVFSHQPDPESIYAESSELSSRLEYVLSAQKTSKCAGHVELQGSPKMHEAVSVLGSPGVCVDKVPLFTNKNEDSEEGADSSVPRSLIEDLDTNVGSDHNRNTRNTDFLIGQEYSRINASNSHLESVQLGQDMEAFDKCIPPVISNPSGSLREVKEDIVSEVLIRELQDALCMKETELENIITLMNAQAAKNFEERGMHVKFLMHVVKRLSNLVPQGSCSNEYADLQFKLFDADISGSAKFDQFVQDYDCWMDKVQKDLEEKSELEAAKRNLEDTQSMKDGEIKELLKQVEDLSRRCNELQKDSDEKEQKLKSRTNVLEESLKVKDSDIERLSDVVSELSHKCDVTMDEMVKAVEEKVEMEGNVKQLEALLIVKNMDIGRLSDEVSELSKKCDLTMVELTKSMEERVNLGGELKQLEDSLSAKETDLRRMLDSMSELSQKCDLTSAEMGKVLEEKVHLDGELKHFQNLNVEQERKTRQLEERLLIKDTELESFQNLYTELETKTHYLEELLVGKDSELESLQKLYVDEREGHLSMLTQASALAEKVTALLDPPTEVIDGDGMSKLEILVACLHHQYEAILKENKDRVLKVTDSYEMELKTLRALVSEKEIEWGHAQETVDLLTKELSKTKEDGERKLLEAEQKALGVRERLSLAVTKGKGLVQQRDSLKQLLAEKTAELEALTLTHQQELHAKTAALNEAESKAKLNSEAGERVDALESELSYIRNSANALRESFLQKDAVLQKIEELLEDANLPEELQIKDTNEKVEWLLEVSNQKVLTSGEGPSEIITTRRLNTFSTAEQASQTQEIEQLNRKCDEYVRKYRDMAEELAMLEQSLLERNMLIQRWEEMLDIVDMPATIRSKEPEDKIQWLGTAVCDAQNSIAHLQADMENLQTSTDVLNHSVQKLQEQNSVLSAELIAKEDELRAVTLDLEDMTMKFNSLPKSASESSDEACRPVADTRDLEMSESNQEESQQHQLQIGNFGVFIPKIRTLLMEVLEEDEVDKMFEDVSASAAFETLVKHLVENSKVWLTEARDTSEKLSDLTLAMRKAEEDGEKQLQILHEAVSSKTLEVNNLNSQLEGFGAKITYLEDEVDQLQKEVKAKTEELSFVRNELNKSHSEASQGEEKLASVREKLSMAVKKGKSVVQQRDTLKQSLDEKVAELDQLRRDYETESIAFTKAKQSFKHQLQELEAELTSSRKYGTTLEKSLQENNKIIQKFAEALDKIAISGAPRSGDLMEKIQWTSQLVLDLQKKSGINEQEAKKSKKATELLALELEEVQARTESLVDDLQHAEKNISLLIEEKKLAEASKAEAGLRLEHAMANINSLLFELSELKEAQANVEQENSSLKDSLTAQMEEIRSKHTKAEEQLKDLTDLYNKVHALKANGSIYLDRAAHHVCKLSENVRATRRLIVRISGELEEQASVTLPAALDFVEDFPSKWEPEFLNKRKSPQEWKQGVTTSSIKLLCEEMEVDFQHFDTFLDNFVVALNQESAANCQLLSELHNGLGSFAKRMETLKRDADLASSTESLILQKDEQIKALEEVFKEIVEKVRSCVDEVEGFRKRSGSFISPLDAGHPFLSHESVQNLTISFVERLSSSVNDLVQSCQQACIEGEQQNEELKFQLKEARDVIDAMGQQQQKEKLKLQKCLEEFEGKDDILKRTNEELCSLHDILATKNQEESGLVEALQKAETTVGQLSGKVEELEKAKQELEASLGKASSRFYATFNNFNKFQSLSEKLIEEAESLHLLLEDRDAQISLLKDEVTCKASEVTGLQNLVNERTSDLSQVYQQLGGIVNREAFNGELQDPGRRREILEAIAMSVRAGSESLRVQLARKDALLQDIQLRYDDLARKVHVLESAAQDSQRSIEERGSAEHMMITVEAEDKGNRGKHSTPSVALVTHGRGGRKVAADHSALDVDTESARLLADVDDEDKGHVFKPLTSSRLVPRGTRILVDRLDGFWVSGERLLRRRPGARLTVMLYWLVLNIWMVVTLL